MRQQILKYKVNNSMRAESRSGKSLKNILYGTGASLLQFIFPFFSRTVFIYVLGESYLGINGLFSSILSMLSLAEMGIGNIVTFSLYKLLAEKNTQKLGAYVSFYKIVYRIIAVIVFCIGILLVPFIPYLINLPDNIQYIYLYYILYVVNSSISYLFVYKISIISADQKEYIISFYTTIFTALMHLAQCIILLMFKSFMGYLIIQILYTIVLNFVLSRKADSFYDLKNCETLSKDERKDILIKAKAMLSYKLGGVFLNSTDSVYISVLVNTITVGRYTNYTILENFLNKFINIIYNGLYASVGNLNAIENKKKSKHIFNILMLVFSYIGTVSFTGYFLVSSKIIEFWIGKSYCIKMLAVLALALRFYMPIILYPIWMYRNTTGLFEETKGILIYAGIINLVLSYFLGKKLSLAGILFATSISRLLTSFWYEPVILYKKMFTKSRVTEYFFNVFFSIVCIGITVFSCLLVEVYFFYNIGIGLSLEMIMCIVIPFFLYAIRYRRTDEVAYLISILKNKCK
jgi:hypothetical protein